MSYKGVWLLSLACGEPLKVPSREVRWSDLVSGRVAGLSSGRDRLNRGAAGHWARPQMAMNSGQRAEGLKEGMAPTSPSRNFCSRSSRKARICISPRTRFLVCWGR